MDKARFEQISKAVDASITRVMEKGGDDVFKPPVFSKSIETEVIEANPGAFKAEAKRRAIKFLKAANLGSERIGHTQKSLVAKDQNTFRQVAWLDPFDAVKYLAAAILLFETIEAARLPATTEILHSHRLSKNPDELFDKQFGYDSFRSKSSELSKARIGKWKVVTDISNFFDRIGNHSLENHLLNIGCDRKFVHLIREMLYFWAGDRRSFGVPVGSDASRILSEAVLLNVDEKLNAAGIAFVRYVDDFRIFADTRLEALRHVAFLTELLAEEGLTLNSRKTDIIRIVDPEEIESATNNLVGEIHEKIDLAEKIEVTRTIRVSGRSSISRFYREPGQDALRKIKSLDKATIISDFLHADEGDVETRVKLLMKFFIYAEQDAEILSILLEKRTTSIFYIVDALEKEAERIDPQRCEDVKEAIFDKIDWLKCAYPLQIPILRIASHPSFRDPRFVTAIVDAHLQTGSIVFFREAIALGSQCLDRSRIRKLALDVFPNTPDFVRRTIYSAVKNHGGLSDDEKPPLLKNMKQQTEDWFIERL